MLYSSNLMDRQYFINKVAIKNYNSQKDLGITIISDLKPSVHITNICKQVNQQIGMIRRCFTNHSNSVVVHLWTTPYPDPSMVTRSRGHKFKIVKQHCRTDVRQQYFSNRILKEWNRLAHKIVTAPILQIFKDQLEIVTFSLSLRP